MNLAGIIQQLLITTAQARRTATTGSRKVPLLSALRIAVFVEKRPRGPVVLFPVATVEGRDVLDDARRSVGKPVVDDLAREDLSLGFS